MCFKEMWNSEVDREEKKVTQVCASPTTLIVSYWLRYLEVEHDAGNN